MRRLLSAGVGISAVLSLVLVACAGGGSSSDSVVVAEPAALLVDSDVTGVPDGAWVAGGATWTDDHGPWVANRSAVHLSQAGEVLSTIDLPIGDGEFLFHNSVVESARVSPHLVGVVCPLKADDPSGLGCGAEVRTIVVDLVTGKDRAGGLPPIEPVVGAGFPRALGTVGDEILISRSDALGPFPGTIDLQIYAISVASGDVRTIARPDTIMTPDSVCLAGDELLVLAPELSDDLYVESLDVMAVSPAGPTDWQVKQTLDLTGKQVQGGGIACSSQRAVLWAASASELVITQRDPAVFEQLGTDVSLSGTTSVEHVAFAPTTGEPLVSVKEMLDGRSTYIGGDVAGAWSTFGELAVEREIGSVAVFAGSGVFDALDLKQAAMTPESSAETPDPLRSATYAPVED